MYQISLEESLQKIFSTPLGSYPLIPEFGMDFSVFDSPLTADLLTSLKSHIKKQIECFEPRLKLKDIKLKAQQDSITITLIAQDSITITLSKENA